MFLLFLFTIIYLGTLVYANTMMIKRHFELNAVALKKSTFLSAVNVILLVGLICCLWYISKPYFLIKPVLTWILLIIDIISAIITIYLFEYSIRKSSKN